MVYEYWYARYFDQVVVRPDRPISRIEESCRRFQIDHEIIMRDQKIARERSLDLEKSPQRHEPIIKVLLTLSWIPWFYSSSRTQHGSFPHRALPSCYSPLHSRLCSHFHNPSFHSTQQHTRFYQKHLHSYHLPNHN
jgi:hypothetical protein